MFNEDKIKEVYKKLYDEAYERRKEWLKVNYPKMHNKQKVESCHQHANYYARIRLTKDFHTFVDRITKDLI